MSIISLLGNHFHEVYLKTKIKNSILKNYFNFNVGEYSIINAINHDEKFIINGFVWLNILDPSSNLKVIGENDKYQILGFSNDPNNFQAENYFNTNIENILEFYSNSEEKLGEKLYIDKIIVVKEIFNFYQKYSNYFSEIDNYFDFSNVNVLLSASSFIILMPGKKDFDEIKKVNQRENERDSKFNEFYSKIKSNREYNKVSNFTPNMKGNKKIPIDFNCGDEIISINSNLTQISYDHFSKSISKGIISGKITDGIFLLDIRVLPNSHGGIVYMKDSLIPIAIILPILNVKYSYTPLIFSFSFDKLMNIIEIVYHKNKKEILFESLKNNKLSATNYLDENDILNYGKGKDLRLKNNLKENLQYLEDCVFAVYTSTNYASCFYVGYGYFITNKHYFEDTINKKLRLKNGKFADISVDKIYSPNNSFDIGIMKLSKNQKSLKIIDSYMDCRNSDDIYQFLINNLKPIKIDDKKINVLDEIYSVGYCYFTVFDILDFNIPFIHRGIVSKKIFLSKNNPICEIIYQVDSCTYNGGSGCPFVDNNGFLVGFLYQNLKFHNSHTNIQLPNSGFIISKFIIQEIIGVIKQSESLNDEITPEFDKIKIFSLSEDIINPIFNFLGFNPKF